MTVLEATARPFPPDQRDWRDNKWCVVRSLFLCLVPYILTDQKEEVRAAAARILGQIRDARAIEPLLATLKETQLWSLARAAAQALGQIGDVRAVEPLVGALKGQDWQLRLVAAQALGQIGDAHSVRSLVTFVNDADIAEKVVEALRKILEHAIGDVGPKDLRAVAQLQDANQMAFFPTGRVRDDCVEYRQGLQRVDCSQLRQLTRQELIRRWLEA